MTPPELAELNRKVVTRFECLTQQQMRALDESTAAALQTGTFKQRRQSETVILRYTRDILNGDWMLNPQPITITADNYILDGWHRIKAGIKSGKSVVFNVTRNWPDLQTFKVLDAGRARTNHQILAMTGMNYVARHAAISRTIAEICSGRSKFGALSVSEIERILTVFGKSTETMIEIAKQAPTRNNPSETLACLVFLYDHSPSFGTFADDFYGMRFSDGSPARALRRYLDRLGRKNSGPIVLHTMNALHAFFENRTVQTLTMKQDGLLWARRLQASRVSQVQSIIGKT